MDLIDRIDTLLKLGDHLQNMDDDQLSTIIANASASNPWFTDGSVRHAFSGLIHLLNVKKFETWIDRYVFPKSAKKNIGVVMAGNIPMVGIHDLICVLISGHRLIAKLSKDDDVLIPFIRDQLIEINPELGANIQFVERLSGIDAVIATGSDNTSRYFEYYFRKYPHIIRKNRTSVAILNGDESAEDLENLGDDLFLYFGLGCRNVSKIFIPAGYELRTFISRFEKYSALSDHNKYCNNYHYNKSVFLVNMEDHLDNGFALFKQSQKLVSPIAVIYFDFYADLADLQDQLKDQMQKIQCLITNESVFKERVGFGKAQKPIIWDYADNVDTMKFLHSL